MLADGQLMNAAAYAPMVIAYRNGNPVRLGDVARVYDGVEQDKTANWYQGLRNINLSILKQPGTNVVAVVDDDQGAAAVVPRSSCRRRCCSTSEPIGRQSIRESVHDVKLTLLADASCSSSR